MSKYQSDSRIVLTLDAGGTNMVFGAMRGNEFVASPVTLPSNAHDLDLCLETMVKGFKEIVAGCGSAPSAISFAFPGPADYPHGIIGGFLPNFPSFRDGVALGPFLENVFGIPVFINNDGDLFAYGEALGGMLPEINARLENAGSAKRFKNLIGYTFGTGLGIGVVMDGRLNRGDNSCVETFCLPLADNRDVIVEDGASIRAVIRYYREFSGLDAYDVTPKDIFEIAEGLHEGDRAAAMMAFERFGTVAGDAIATAVTLTDGLVVLGGGLVAAAKYFMPSLLEEMRRRIYTLSGDELGRLQSEVYNLDDPGQFDRFAAGDSRRLKVYGSDRYVVYDPMKRTGVAVSKLGASKAISVGAYNFALSQLDGE